jgi:tetratricopeptide (TPR) repeat protein/serine/threonine protein kinase
MTPPQPNPPVNADRNLLFGILALQMDFISRDALIAAMQAWVFAKATPLGQILMDQGALKADDHNWLEAMVQKHLQKHANDPAQSLAAVSSVGSLREDLKRIADPDLHASLAHVSAARQVEEDPYVTRASSVGLPTSTGRRFRVLRPHRKGGLGQVSVAHDEELHREVALKEIQDRHADDPHSRARFLLEAEITGGLEHPGIVPVYGLGHYADGRPFYAMRFIKGDSLKEAIDRFHRGGGASREPGERTLGLRKLLGRFVDVCDAIDYAHARGVLHRDLKPGNIMLGHYGETLVVDWGLAKPLGKATGTASDELPLLPSAAGNSEPTSLGARIGTPAYMSPEQAAGRLDKLESASDVYSLGATLYAVLTGCAPFEDSDGGPILERVCKGEFPVPRVVKPDVPRALEAVCLKAMALRPADRYTSVRDLSEDLEHWLADEPVKAYREPAHVRLRRWRRRHPALAATAAVLLLVASAGGMWLKQQRDTRLADEVRQSAETQAAVLASLQEADLGQKQERWAEARAAVERARGRLATGGPAELKERVQQIGADLDMVGKVEQIRLEQAQVRDGHFNNTGASDSYTAAFRTYNLDVLELDAREAATRIQASAIRNHLLAALDDWAFVSDDWVIPGAKTAERTARRQRLLDVIQLADVDAWRREFRNVVVRRDKLALEQLARQLKTSSQPVVTVLMLGKYLAHAGAVPAAVEVLRQAQQRHPADFWVHHDLAHNLLELKPAPVEEALGCYRAALALRPQSPGVYLNFGNALRQHSRLTDAIAAYQQAIALKPDYGEAYCNLALALFDNGQFQEAVHFSRTALSFIPHDPLSYHALGKSLLKVGWKPDAAEAIRQGIVLNSEAAGSLLSGMGTELVHQGRTAEAADAFRRAVAVNPKDGIFHYNLGNALLQQGLLEDAEAAYRSAVTLQPDHAWAWSNLGSVLGQHGQSDQAITVFRKAIALNPDLAPAHNGLGLALSALGRLQEATVAFRTAVALSPADARPVFNLVNCLVKQHQLDEAIAVARQAVARQPNNATVQFGLATALREHGDLEEAAAAYRKAITLEPKNAVFHARLGYTLHKLGQLSEAVSNYQKAIALQSDLFLSHYDNLASALIYLGRLREAAATYRKAIALKPDSASAYFGLGNVLTKQELLADAAVAYRQAIALKPVLAPAHLCLGNTLMWRGLSAEAIAAFREAVHHDPQLAEAHCNLGLDLLRQGAYTEALASLKRGHEIGSKKAGWFYPSAQWIKEAEQFVALESRLPALLHGEGKPANAGESLCLAQMCQHPKHHYAASARFFSEAFAAQQRLAEDFTAGHRYHAACVATLAANGQGEDAAKLDDKERARLRKQALDWLRADLALWAQVLDGAQTQARTGVQKYLQYRDYGLVRPGPPAPVWADAQKYLRHCQTDPGLAAMRDGAALAKLPEAERAACRKLWADVEQLLKKADAAAKTHPKKAKPATE